MTKYLHGKIPVRVVGSDFCLFLIERIDDKPLDDYGLRKRDWVAKGCVKENKGD